MQAAEEAVAAEGVEGLAGVAEDEEYKYDVADTSWFFLVVSDGDRRGGEGVEFGLDVRCTYRSRLMADRCAPPARP